jgi:hypothetical protein
MLVTNKQGASAKTRPLRSVLCKGSLWLLLVTLLAYQKRNFGSFN